jgi:hypothetical protein
MAPRIDTKIVVTDKKLLKKLETFFKIDKRLKDAIGLDAVSFSQDSFRNQGLYKKGEWPARTVPNVAGIWKDLNLGQQIKTRRLDPRPALVDTGVARNSIAYQWQGNEKMRLGTNRQYMKNQQLGLPSTQKKLNPEHFNAGITKFLRQNKKRLSDREYAQIASLMAINELTVTPKKRRFLGYTVARLKEVVLSFKKSVFK